MKNKTKKQPTIKDTMQKVEDCMENIETFLSEVELFIANMTSDLEESKATLETWKH